MANPYLQVLRCPHALPMVLSAFIGRLPLSMVGLGCVLLVASETGSYGLGRHQEYAAQPDHRQRQPADERGQHHRQGVRGPQHLQVGIGHERGASVTGRGAPSR